MSIKLKKEYIDDVNLLKLDEKSLEDDNSDALISELDEALALKIMSNDNNNDIEDDQEIDNVINIEEEKEK